MSVEQVAALACFRVRTRRDTLSSAGRPRCQSDCGSDPARPVTLTRIPPDVGRCISNVFALIELLRHVHMNI